VAQPLVAVDQRGRRSALKHRDGGAGIEHAALELAHIAGEAKDAVGIRAGEIGLQHPPGDGRGIGLGQPAGAEDVGEKGLEGRGGEAPGGFNFGLRQQLEHLCGTAWAASFFRPRQGRRFRA
jgi:hypothetical protein